jgi:hypothetical protein
MKTRAILPAVWACLSLSASGAWAWGGATHRAILQEATNVLPGPLKGFYQTHRLELPSLSPEGRNAEDAADQRFAVDRLLAFPFHELPHAEADVVARFGEDAKSIGRLPWAVRDSYPKLVAAFKAADKTQILSESDALAAVVAELHNPLALTDNADGQKTGQPGLWVRFTQRFPIRVRGHLSGDAAYLIDEPAQYPFAIITNTYIWADNILYADDIAHRQDPTYGGVYYESMEHQAGSILHERLNWAARDVASYWYTAWVAAGKPELR